VIVATVGAMLLVFGKGVNMDENTLIGDLLILGNSTVYAIYVIMVTPMMRKYHSVTVMKIVFMLAIPVVLPVGGHHLVLAKWDAMGLIPWLALAFIVFIGTIYNYYINTWSLKHVSPSVNGGYIYTIPFLATVFAVAMGKDVLTLDKVIYGALIFTGVYLVGKKLPT
jgi:drug/metabolite transporter (DMT)-like permease